MEEPTAKRVLFLADRNILVDQTIVNDFKPFGAAMKKLDRKLVDKATARSTPSYEIYLSLYQAIIGDEDRESDLRQVPAGLLRPHRHRRVPPRQRQEDSAWREILEYFDSAIQLGMTATPKETKYVSNIHYFGEPVYTYSLKQGIEDGFLAPYKVVRVDLDMDLQGWRPETGQIDDIGDDIEDQIYNQRDFDRTIVFPERDAAVAQHITEYMHDREPCNKTILFCENIDHAERMRQALVNEPANRALVQADSRYVMRITGDNDEGKAQLDNFIDPKQQYPVIATTSKLMSTGVDAQTCHVIALDQRIQSLSEFKQIIGRGTRLRADYGKYYFTIIDFRKATELFADPDWDGPPIQVSRSTEPGRRGHHRGRTRRPRRHRPHRDRGDLRRRSRHVDDASAKKTRRGPQVHGQRRDLQGHRRTHPVLRQGRKTRHRVAQGLHPPRRPRGVHHPRRLPQAVEGS